MPNPGFKIFKKVISKKSSLNLFNTLDKLLKIHSPDLFNVNFSKGWSDKRLHEQLIHLRTLDKQIFSRVYDSMLKSKDLRKFCDANNLFEVASKFLKVPKKFLTTAMESNPNKESISFRMDVPNDTRNLYGWHQDTTYNKSSRHYSNYLTLWIPMLSTTKKNGTLIVKPNSHLESNTTHIVKRKKTKYQSEQIVIKDKYLKKFTSKHVNVKENDVMAAYSSIYHKSGYNSSKNVRFVFIIRFTKTN